MTNARNNETLLDSLEIAIDNNNEAIECRLRALNEELADDACGVWFVVATDFHGGNVVSRHKSALLAAKAAKRHGIAGCECGYFGCGEVRHESQM